MVWHVHYNGEKFAIWSTIIDNYITHWDTQEQIVKRYQESALKEATEVAFLNIGEAFNTGCSASYQFKCKDSESTTNSEEVKDE